ncbi:hypothetical protein WA026_011091 [Henosepilachna vigintioctopunctata]|uniref:Large ribosomal subunit protein bL34m n=1 Tax=Henosepilachna vigintioctopunctata TaxID=420089 RepID=A0AAW1U767_9CUCU
MQCFARITSIFLKPSLTGPTTNTFVPNTFEKCGGILGIFSRNIVRDHFPRPSETKRVRRHGFKKRMSTATGRRILMNRILKGRWVISH